MMGKKKIAILTQPLGGNYGGVIQNYALQQILLRKGFEVETVNRVGKESILYMTLFNIKNYLYHKPRGRFKKIFSKSEHKIVKKEINRFIRSKMMVSKDIDTTTELKEYFGIKKYNAVIIGSDQTWRPMYSPNIYNYYLDFLEEDKQLRKIAYASSFGMDSWEYSEKETITVRKLVKNFDAISVRERLGVDLCKEYLGTDSELVLDPTLLLEREDYIALFDDENRQKRDGIFSYMLDIDADKQNFLANVSKYLEKAVFYNQPKRAMSDNIKFTHIEDYKYPSLESWLSSFYDTDFVITDSFHGTVFSIIFNKPFLTIINSERGASRFYSLLGQLGLENRIISDIKNIELEKIDEKIDYNKVNEKIDKLRAKSIEFLFRNLEGL